MCRRVIDNCGIGKVIECYLHIATLDNFSICLSSYFYTYSSAHSLIAHSTSAKGIFFVIIYKKSLYMQNQSFQFMLGGTPYEVKAVPFRFNEGTRYTVTINGSGEYVFAYDSNVGQYVPLDDESAAIPQVVETEIAGRLLALAG
jgi:hypothetical protein